MSTIVLQTEEQVKALCHEWRLSNSDTQEAISQFQDLYPKLSKWYEEVKISCLFPEKKLEIEIHKKTPREIGVALEGLVETALRSLGCEVEPPGKVRKDEYGSNWIIKEKEKREKLHPKITSNLPSFKEEGEFKDRGFIFKHHSNVADKVDFESNEIAIEVKNRDPTIPYKTLNLFHKDILNRFKKVRKKARYLLIPQASNLDGFTFTPEQRKMLEQRHIKEINIKAQFRWNNEKEAYESVFYALRKILLTHL